MARTKNPHAAAIKSWDTRRKGAVAGTGAAGLVSEPDTAEVELGVPGYINHKITTMHLHAEDKARQRWIAQQARAGLDLQRFPKGATDGIKSILCLPKRAMAGPDGSNGDADYNGETMGIRVDIDGNTEYRPFVGNPELQKRGLGKLLAHEIGHHVLLSRLTNKAAREWFDISLWHMPEARKPMVPGANCRLSQYGGQNVSEHFAEAFAAFAQPDPSKAYGKFDRETLKRLEPRTYAFMERLWNDRSMWRPDGESEYHYGRGHAPPFEEAD
jgi:hypothetical protein